MDRSARGRVIEDDIDPLSDPSITELDALVAQYQANKATGKPRRRAWWREPQEGAETDYQVILARKLQALEAPLEGRTRRRRITDAHYRAALSEAMKEASAPNVPPKATAESLDGLKATSRTRIARKPKATVAAPARPARPYRPRPWRIGDRLPAEPFGPVELRKVGTVAPRQLGI
jgi:hypothetical protein